MTTSYSDTELVADRIRNNEVDNRSQVLKDLRTRKLANTGTSIILGSHALHYESDAMSRGHDADGAAPRGDVVAAQKAMKKALTATHFVLGDDDLDYTTQTKDSLVDTTGRIHEYQGKLNQEVERFIKRSSLYIGSDGAPQYGTTTSDALAAPGEFVRSQRDAARAAAARGDEAAAVSPAPGMRDEARRLKSKLGRHNFSLGDFELSYSTEQKEQMLWEAGGARAAQGVMSKATKADLQSSHFSLGVAPLAYETTTRDSQKCAGITRERIQEMAASAQNARDLKAMLLATKVVIGSDSDYM